MRSIRTPVARARFLEALSDCGIVSQAYETAGISREAIYSWRRDDPDFRDAWEEALALGVNALEDKAMEFARNGSEKLIMFILTARKPELYGQRQAIEFTGNVNLNVRRAPLDELRSELAQLLGAQAVQTIEHDPADNVVSLRPQDEDS